VAILKDKIGSIKIIELRNPISSSIFDVKSWGRKRINLKFGRFGPTMTQRQDFYNLVKERSQARNFFFRPILMRFAANHIGKSYREFYTDHQVLVEANLACKQDFGMDAVGLISDPMREAEAFGAICRYPEENIPHCPEPLIKTNEDVLSLYSPDLMISNRTRDRVLSAYLFRRKLGQEFPVIGWIEGPLAEACNLVGVSEMLIKLATDPEFCKLLLSKLVDMAKKFALAQIEAGCNIIGVGDAICSQISPQMYAKFVLDHHQDIINFIHNQDALVKLHICGDITRLLPHIADIKPDIVDLDWMVDPQRAYDILGPNIIRSGNLDPVAIIEQLSAEEVFIRTQELLVQECGRAFILSGGCEITPKTPPENLKAMQEATKLS
jgi:MtaA/CmuA family methyltransferase